MIESKTNHCHLTLSAVKQIINQTFVNQSFRKHMDNLVHRNAQTKFSQESVSYVNSIMQRLVVGSSIRPSNRSNQKEDDCLTPTSDIIRVKILKNNRMTNSSINFGSFTDRKRSILSNPFKDQVNQGEFDKCLHAPLTIYSKSNKKKLLPTQKTSNLMKIQRASTQSNFHRSEASFPSKKLQQVLLPITPTEQSTDRSNSIQSQLNQQLDHHIESLRNRKLKLEAAFINFDNQVNNQGSMIPKDKDNQNAEKKGTTSVRSKLQMDGQFKIIVTDYDGQVMNKNPTQKLKKINFMNKQNHYNSGSFAPTVRIKTQISPNFSQLQQNMGEVNSSKRSTGKKFMQPGLSQSRANLNSSESTSKKEFVFSMQKFEGKVPESVGGKKYLEKQTKKQIFTIETLFKSKRMIEKKVII